MSQNRGVKGDVNFRWMKIIVSGLYIGFYDVKIPSVFTLF